MVMNKIILPPPLSASGSSLAEAWENAYLKLADNGMIYRREDEADKGDQIAAIMDIEVRNPDLEPFSHKKGGTNAIAAPLLDYDMEILGAKDSWVRDFNDPEDKRWDYMYHERFALYPNPKGSPIDQVEFMIQRLIERSFSRRTQMITWYPERDTKAKDTPCLQRIWIETIPTENGDWLDMHYSFRSRNVVNASFGNMQGIYLLGCHIRDKVEEATGKNLSMRMIEKNDSYHVNSKDYPKFWDNVRHIKESRDFYNRIEREGRNPTEQEKDKYNRFFSRKEVIEILGDYRDYVESEIMRQTEKHFKGDIDKEKERVHGIGERVFYLLNKYSGR